MRTLLSRCPGLHVMCQTQSFHVQSERTCLFHMMNVSGYCIEKDAVFSLGALWQTMLWLPLFEDFTLILMYSTLVIYKCVRSNIVVQKIFGKDTLENTNLGYFIHPFIHLL